MDRMGSIKVNLPDELDEKFRAEVFESKGMKRGNLKDAIREAILIWIEVQQKKRRVGEEAAGKNK